CLIMYWFVVLSYRLLLWQPIPTLFPYTTLFRSQFSEKEEQDMTFALHSAYVIDDSGEGVFQNRFNYMSGRWITIKGVTSAPLKEDRKSTRLNSSHVKISYAVFCLKKKILHVLRV